VPTALICSGTCSTTRCGLPTGDDAERRHQHRSAALRDGAHRPPRPCPPLPTCFPHRPHRVGARSGPCRIRGSTRAYEGVAGQGPAGGPRPAVPHPESRQPPEFRTARGRAAYARSDGPSPSPGRDRNQRAYRIPFRITRKSPTPEKKPEGRSPIPGVPRTASRNRVEKSPSPGIHIPLRPVFPLATRRTRGRPGTGMRDGFAGPIALFVRTSLGRHRASLEKFMRDPRARLTPGSTGCEHATPPRFPCRWRHDRVGIGRRVPYDPPRRQR
jgi:hypothetical protein